MNSYRIPCLFVALLTSVALAGPSTTARAAEVSGLIVAEDGSPLDAIEVRLWRDDSGKGHSIVFTALTAADGLYAFTEVPAGIYLLDARMGPGRSGNLGDLWYDVAEPFGNGLLASVADELDLADDTVLTGMDFTLPLYGGFDGRIIGSDRPLVGVLVRAERTSMPQYHHNDFSDEPRSGPDTEPAGQFFFRGLFPADDYRLMVYDPNANFETTIVPGPWAVTADAVGDIGDSTVPPMGVDPFEPNDSPREAGADRVDSELFRLEPPEAWIATGAIIGPRNADVDWFCFEAVAHDRFLVATGTDLELPGEVREHPNVDPVLAFFTGDGSTMLVTDDDGAGDSLNAVLDTGDIAEAGRYCVVVSTFGDTEFSGAGQQSAGRYQLIIELGNRVPWMEAFVAGAPAPVPPGRAIVAEGGTFRIDVEFGDPDGDEVAFDAFLVDNTGAEVEGGVVEFGEDAGSFEWPVGERAAELSPYELTMQVSDREFVVTSRVVIDTRAVNLPPETPLLVAPDDGTSVATATPELVVENAFDPDGDALTYDFEVHYGDPSAAPDEVGIVDEDPSGQTAFVVSPIGENQPVSWRARARDGALDGGTSAWSDYWTFTVNVDNEPPLAPILIKPEEGEVVIDRTPVLAATNTEDPDRDRVFLRFEIATTREFTEIIRDSGPVAQSEVGSRTNWGVEDPLEWGATYFARVRSEDPFEAASAYSNIHGFQIKPNQEPEDPGLGGIFAESCEGVVITDELPTAIIVPPIIDPEAEEVTIEVELWDADADFEAGMPLFADTTFQPPGHEEDHVFELPPDILVENGHYVVRVRASDGEEDTGWHECDFWIDFENSAPIGLEIISPEDGTIVPADALDLEVVVSNASDPDGEHDDIVVAWCASAADDDTCPADPNGWASVDQTGGPSGQTPFYVEGLVPGLMLTIRACALDARGLWGSIDSITVTVESKRSSETPSLCTCDVRADSGRPGYVPGMALLVGLVLAGVRRRR